MVISEGSWRIQFHASELRVRRDLITRCNSNKGANVETLQTESVRLDFVGTQKHLCLGSFTNACVCRGPIVPLVVPGPRLFLSEMFVACFSVWLPFNETPRRLKCWLPWRQRQTSTRPFMCPCHHLFPPSVWKKQLFPHRCSTTRMLGWNTALQLLNPGPPPKQTCFCTHSKCATKTQSTEITKSLC